MKRLADITADRLRQMMSYDPEIGEFTWLVTINNRARAGRRVGCRDSHAYLLIGIDRCVYVAHRLAWLWMTGEWPTRDIDHINMDKKDNRWPNLRLASRSSNMANTGLRRDNTSGAKGVRWDEGRKRWHAQIRVNGQNKHLGRFVSKEDAIAAYENAALTAFGEFARA